MALFVCGAAGDRPHPCVLLLPFFFCDESALRAVEVWPPVVGQGKSSALGAGVYSASSGPSTIWLSSEATPVRRCGRNFAHYGVFHVCYERRGQLGPHFRPSRVDSQNKGRPYPTRVLCSHYLTGHRSSFHAFFSFLKYGQTSGAAVQRLPCFPSGSWRPRRGVAPQCSRRTPVVPCG